MNVEITVGAIFSPHSFNFLVIKQIVSSTVLKNKELNTLPT